MTVATRDYGKNDFNYPEIKLEGYYMSFNGPIEQPKDEEKEQTEENGEQTEGKSTEKTEGAKPLENIDKNSSPAEVVKSFKQQTAPTPSAPVPNKAPIPMAVPESLR